MDVLCRKLGYECVSLFVIIVDTNRLTSLSFGNYDSTTLKDLLEFVHFQVLVGIARLGAGGDKCFLYRELDDERLQIINSLLLDNGR